MIVLLSVGRLPYTGEEDAAILSYVSKCKEEIGGNRIWQEMEKERVTSHSWQSMKFRYRSQLAQQHSEVVEKTTAEGETEAENMVIQLLVLRLGFLSMLYYL